MVRLKLAALGGGALLAGTALVMLPAPASAAAPGVAVTITDLPDSFGAAADARTVTVVASTDQGRRCEKVRWSLLLSVSGIDLGQARVDRIEEDGSFPVQVAADGDTARITDVQLDPGQLCRGQTVTARYLVAFDGDDEGRVALRAQAFDARGRLLQEAGGSSRIVGTGAADDQEPPSALPRPPAAEPSPSPTESEPEPSAPASEPAAVDDEESAGPTAGATGADDLTAQPAASTGDSSGLLGPGLIIGALLVFAGVGLLIRLRMAMRARPDSQQAMAQVYPAE